MASINYPVNLPSAMRGSLQESHVDNRVQDDRAAGVYNSRVITTKRNLRISYTITINESQKKTLLDFYDITTEGVDIFNWIHPTSNVIYEVVFDDRPQVTTNLSNYQTANVSLITV